MQKEDWEDLKKEAQDFMDHINLVDMSDIDYAMLGASVAILDHKNDNHIQSHTEETNAPKMKETDNINDELRDAEKYLQCYRKTKDADYLQMSFDETTHALKFIRELSDEKEKEKYMAKHDEVSSAIKRQGMTV